MTCAEFQEFTKKYLCCPEEMSRAERAAISAHAINCEECMAPVLERFLKSMKETGRSIEQMFSDDIKKLVNEDFADPEFKEVIGAEPDEPTEPRRRC